MKNLSTLILITTVLLMSTTEALSGDSVAQGKKAVTYKAAAVKQDLVSLYEILQVAHPGLYAVKTKAEYDRFLEASLKSVSESQSYLQSWAILQQFLAFGQIAHARIDFPQGEYDAYRSAGGKTLPVWFEIDKDQLRIGENYSGIDLPASARVISINSRTSSNVLRDLRSYISADSKAIANSLLEFQFPQYLWLDQTIKSKPSRHFILRIEHNTEIERFTVPALDRPAILKNSEKIQAITTKQAALRDFRVIGDWAYLKPGPFYNAESPDNLWDTTNFENFLDRALASFTQNQVNSLLIDLRDNPGGTNSFSDLLVGWYADKPFRFASRFVVRSSLQAKQSNLKRMEQESTPSEVSLRLAKLFESTPAGEDAVFEIDFVEPEKVFSGKVYVLINKASYSNAASVAAISKDYEFATIVGEHTTDFATTYGSMETFELDNTGFTIGFPKALIVRPSGDTELGPVHVDLAIPKLMTTPEAIIDYLSTHHRSGDHD